MKYRTPTKPHRSLRDRPSVSVSQETFERLQRYAKQNNTTMAAIVEQLVLEGC